MRAVKSGQRGHGLTPRRGAGRLPTSGAPAFEGVALPDRLRAETTVATPVQARLKVGSADHPQEREADRIAAAVMSAKPIGAGAPASAAPRRAAPSAEVQRESAASPGPTTSVGPAVEAAPSTLTRGGDKLAPHVQSFYENRLGTTLDDVRVHEGGPSASLNDQLGARAFTYRSHVWLGASERASEPSPTLAHELVHVLQQRAQGSEPPIQRSILDDARAWVARQLVDEETAAFLTDLYASIRESPDHFAEILGEVAQAVWDNWWSFLGVFLAFIAAETAIGALTAAPEPTFLTKLLAFVLQALVFAALGYFAAVELGQVVSHATTWWRQVGEARGDPQRITEASRSFCRMLLHVILLVLTVAGARVRGARPGSSATESAAGATSRAGGRAPRAAGRPQLEVVPGGRSGAPGRPPGGSPSASAYEGSAARTLPERAPVPEPVTPPLRVVEPPPPAPAPSAASQALRGAQPGAGRGVREGAAPAVSEALRRGPQQDPRNINLLLPPAKAGLLPLYSSLLGSLQHRPSRGRDTQQRRNWNNELNPRTGNAGMHIRTYCRGRLMAHHPPFGVGDNGRLSQDDVFRPNWSRSRNFGMRLQVDHKVEMQVAPIGRETTFDQLWNYELLDQASNGSSGPRMSGNITRERQRLASATGDATWLTRDITFTSVTAEPAADAGRWSFDEVAAGAHLDAYQTLTGEPNPDRAAIDYCEQHRGRLPASY